MAHSIAVIHSYHLSLHLHDLEQGLLNCSTKREVALAWEIEINSRFPRFDPQLLNEPSLALFGAGAAERQHQT
eukprot:3756092-Rhodomonas_salina.1